MDGVLPWSCVREPVLRKKRTEFAASRWLRLADDVQLPLTACCASGYPAFYVVTAPTSSNGFLSRLPLSIVQDRTHELFSTVEILQKTEPDLVTDAATRPRPPMYVLTASSTYVTRLTWMWLVAAG